MDTQLKDELVDRLVAIDGIEHQAWPSRDDGFSTLLLRGKEIGHFHNEHELDLRLGSKLIKQEGLVHPAGSTKHPSRSPNSQYIELRFYAHQDLDQIEQLVRLLC